MRWNPDVGHTQGEVSEAAAAAVAFDQLRDRRLASQELEQLDEIGAVADLEKYFTDLVRAQHVLTMHFTETEPLVGADLRFELALADGDGDVVDEQEAGDGGHLLSLWGGGREAGLAVVYARTKPKGGGPSG